MERYEKAPTPRESLMESARVCDHIANNFGSFVERLEDADAPVKPESAYDALRQELTLREQDEDSVDYNTIDFANEIIGICQKTSEIISTALEESLWHILVGRIGVMHTHLQSLRETNERINDEYSELRELVITEVEKIATAIEDVLQRINTEPELPLA